MKRWFVTYWLDYCSSPISIIIETGIKQSLLTALRKIEKDNGTVIFFHQIKDSD